MGSRKGEVLEILSESNYEIENFVRDFNASAKRDGKRRNGFDGGRLGLQVDGRNFPIHEIPSELQKSTGVLGGEAETDEESGPILV